MSLPVLYFLVLLEYIGGLGTLMGYILGFLATLELWTQFPFASRLAERGWLEPLTLLTAFWLGFVGRVFISWNYEDLDNQKPGVRTVTAIATTGLFFALYLFVPRVSVLLMGWSILLAVAGWTLVAHAMTMGAPKQKIKK